MSLFVCNLIMVMFFMSIFCMKYYNLVGLIYLSYWMELKIVNFWLMVYTNQNFIVNKLFIDENEHFY